MTTNLRRAMPLMAFLLLALGCGSKDAEAPKKNATKKVEAADVKAFEEDDEEDEDDGPTVGKLSIEGAGKAYLVGPEGSVLHDLPFEDDEAEPGAYWIVALKGDKGRLAKRVVVEAGGEVKVKVEAAAAETKNAIFIAGVRYPLPDEVTVKTFETSHSSYAASAADVAAGKEPHFRARVFKGKPLPSDDPQVTGRHVDQVVLHHDLVPSSADCFEALTSRGLSTHFMIDWDGTIYQTLDVADEAFQAGVANGPSIGIDLNNVGKNLRQKGHEDHPPYPQGHPALSSENPDHKRTKSEKQVINGGRVQAYGYTPAQYRSLDALLGVLVEALPNLSARFPGVVREKVAMTALADPLFAGITAHWHTAPKRWDPGPGFDWQRVCKGLQERGLTKLPGCVRPVELYGEKLAEQADAKLAEKRLEEAVITADEAFTFGSYNPTAHYVLGTAARTLLGGNLRRSCYHYLRFLKTTVDETREAEVKAFTKQQCKPEWSERAFRVSVKPRDVKATGGLEADDAKGVFYDRAILAEWCYENALEDNDSLAGDVKVKLKLDGTGAVTKASVKSKAVKDAKLLKCIRTTLEPLRFGEPEGGGRAKVSATLVLERS